MSLEAAIAECLALHAEAMDKLGTEYPERLPRVPDALRAKMTRQRDKVSATLESVDPAVHVAQVESLNKGLRLILRKLAPVKSKPPVPPLPVWDAAAKAWRIPQTDTRKAHVDELAKRFDERGPDDPNQLFR
jgi:hypothetical protein